MSTSELRPISQAAFDEAVQDELEMDDTLSPEQAVEAAVETLKIGNVDLTGIVLSATAKEHPILKSINIIDLYSKDSNDLSSEQVISAAGTIQFECSGNPDNKAIARKNDAHVHLLSLIEKSRENPPLLKAVMDALRALLLNSDLSRSFLAVNDFNLFFDIARVTSHPVPVRISVYNFIGSAITKNEVGKNELFNNNFADHILGELKSIVQNEATPAKFDDDNALLVAAMCFALTRLLTDDDLSILASNSFSFARTLGTKSEFPSLLFDILDIYNKNERVSAEVYAAIRALIVADDVCKIMDGLNAIDRITENVSYYVVKDELEPTSTSSEVPVTNEAKAIENARVRMLRYAFGTIKNLSNSDASKVKIGTGKPLNVLLATLVSQRAHASILTEVIGTLSSICLRNQENSAIFVKAGGLAPLASAMRVHVQDPGVQRTGCMLVRNVVSKDHEGLRKEAVMNEGFDEIVKRSYMLHPVARDVAYACLRDIGVEDVMTVVGAEQMTRVNQALQEGTVYIPVNTLGVIRD